MNCERYIILLDEFLNNELDKKLRGSVSAHLENCEACRAEIHSLKLESDFYRKAASLPEQNFTSQWSGLRDRLLAESLVESDSATPQIARNAAPAVLTSAFFVSLKNLFSVKNPVFGTLLLIFLGLATMFLVIRDRNKTEDGNKTEDKTAIAAAPANISNPSSVVQLTENNVSAAEEKLAPEVDDSSAWKKTEKALQKSPVTVKRRGADLPGTGENYKKVNQRVKTANPQLNSVAARQTVESANVDFQMAIAEEDRKLANHLNKVHLFLLIFRNFINEEAINDVIGDKYQTEARVFLDYNNNYKKASLRSKDIPAVELLNEIEPILRAISNLDEPSPKSNIDTVATMIKRSGIVFKIRMWKFSAKLDGGL